MSLVLPAILFSSYIRVIYEATLAMALYQHIWSQWQAQEIDMGNLTELYAHMVSVINDAHSKSNIYAVPKAAEQAGMVGGETTRGMTQRWDYEASDATGNSVQVHCRWYDQSKPFSIQPDKNIMTVTMNINGEKQSHTMSYED